jgi:hypothetical protein
MKCPNGSDATDWLFETERPAYPGRRPERLVSSALEPEALDRAAAPDNTDRESDRDQARLRGDASLGPKYV